MYSIQVIYSVPDTIFMSPPVFCHQSIIHSVAVNKHFRLPIVSFASFLFKRIAVFSISPNFSNKFLLSSSTSYSLRRVVVIEFEFEFKVQREKKKSAIVWIKFRRINGKDKGERERERKAREGERERERKAKNDQIQRVDKIHTCCSLLGCTG